VVEPTDMTDLNVNNVFCCKHVGLALCVVHGIFFPINIRPH
jgi:hypothetical protein